MERVSSQLTIFIRIALPTIWLTTVISLVALLSWAVRGRAHLFANPFIWIGLILILLTGYFFIKFILWKIYRVDMDNRHLLVSNYFKTFKYPFEDIESITDADYLKGRVYKIKLKAKGSFGQNIHFLASRTLWEDFIKEHPYLFEEILHIEKRATD